MSGNIMSIIETGIISNGIPVFTLDSKTKLKSNLILRSGYFSALQNFVKTTFKDETQELRMKTFTVCMKNAIIHKQEMTFYAIVDKDTKSMEDIHSGLDKVISNLQQQNIKSCNICTN